MRLTEETSLGGRHPTWLLTPPQGQVSHQPSLPGTAGSVGSVATAPGTTAFGSTGTGDATSAGEASGTGVGEATATGSSGGTMMAPGRMSEVLLTPGAGGATGGGSTSGVTTDGGSGAVVLVSGKGERSAGTGAGLVGTVLLLSPCAGGVSC
jgi:hypothetical protein